jgi:hypothetical protein
LERIKEVAEGQKVNIRRAGFFVFFSIVDVNVIAHHAKVITMKVTRKAKGKQSLIAWRRRDCFPVFQIP